MSITWHTDTDGIDWLELEHLYRVAPLGNKSAAHLQTVYGNSRFVCLARQGGRLLAAGRALADGADCSYICDVAVRPDHQGSGLGKQVVQRLVEASRDHKKIILYSVPRQGGLLPQAGLPAPAHRDGDLPGP